MKKYLLYLTVCAFFLAFSTPISADMTSLQGSYTAEEALSHIIPNDLIEGGRTFPDGSLSTGNLTVTATNTGKTRDMLYLEGQTSFTNDTYLNLIGRDLVFLSENSQQQYNTWHALDPFFTDSVGHPVVRVDADYYIEQLEGDKMKLSIKEKYATIEITFKKTSTEVSAANVKSEMNNSLPEGFNIAGAEVNASSYTGYMWIAGAADEEPIYLSSNQSGTGWTWDASTDTLTLSSSYTGQPIYIAGVRSEVTIEINGNVTVNGGTVGAPIRVDSDVRFTGSGTLNLVPSTRGNEYSIPTVYASGTITFAGTVTNASAEGELNRAIASEYHDVVLKGDADVTAKAQGTKGYAVYTGESLRLSDRSSLVAEGVGENAAGVIAKRGDIIVNDDAKLIAKGDGDGYAVDIREGKLEANNDNVVLLAEDEEKAISEDVKIEGTGTVSKDVNTSISEYINKLKDKVNEFLGGGGGGGCEEWTMAGLGLAFLTIALMLKMRFTK